MSSMPCSMGTKPSSILVIQTPCLVLFVNIFPLKLGTLCVIMWVYFANEFLLVGFLIYQTLSLNLKCQTLLRNKGRGGFSFRVHSRWGETILRQQSIMSSVWQSTKVWFMVVSKAIMVDVDFPIFGSSLVKTENPISNLN